MTATPTILPNITPFPYTDLALSMDNTLVVITLAVIAVFVCGVAIRQAFYFINSVFK